MPRDLTQRLRSHVYQLAERIGERNVFRPAALRAAEVYIRDVWYQYGYSVTAQEYSLMDIRCSNLEVTKVGTRHANKTILVGAHYDSVAGAPGANDNGSGVATLLEMSRLLSDTDNHQTIRFVAFVNEEPPFFHTHQQGSYLYARAARQRSEDIRLMIALETIGYFRDQPNSQHYPPFFRFFFPDRANFIAFVANFRSRPVLRKLARAFRNASDFPLQYLATSALVPGVSWSDHLWFWRHGYRAVMVTDTAFYRYPYYHGPGDTAEKLDYERLAQLAEGLAAAIARLACSPL